jgi:hypothetical protein
VSSWCRLGVSFSQCLLFLVHVFTAWRLSSSYVNFVYHLAP